MASTIRILLADDYSLVRAGIRTLLSRIQGVEVIGEAANGPEALRMIKDLRPDVVLLDLTMPGLSGLQVLEQSTRVFPDVRVIVLTIHEAAEYALRALRAGAAGYLPKSAAADELQEALETVSSGEIYVSSAVANKSILKQAKEAEQRRLLKLLTPRQREILTLVAGGRTTKEIARSLHISVKTVETHRARLMDTLSIHDVAGLVRYALTMGLVNVE